MTRRIVFLLVASLWLNACPCFSDDFVRPANLAGSWYKNSPQALTNDLTEYLSAKLPDLSKGRILGIVTPHAGHRYSGAIAGKSWEAAQSANPLTVILLGPSHRVYLSQPSIWPKGAYDSPLGKVAIDQSLAQNLTKTLNAQFKRKAHLAEHCLEVQIPFIKQALPKAKIVPILLGKPDQEKARQMGKNLAQTIKGKPILLAASTDLSHFHDQKTAQQMDNRLGQCFENLNIEKLFDLYKQGQIEACGLQALAVVIFASKELGAKQGLILQKGTSGSMTGDYTSVVGYMAGVVTTDPNPKAQNEKKILFDLNSEQKQKLLKLAQDSLQAAVYYQDLPSFKDTDPVFQKKLGAFVTLREHGRLRGCIGRINVYMPLAQTVSLMTQAAALQDPRFPAVKPSELKDITIEISVLTPFMPIKPEDVVVGKHGLLLELGHRRGLLLPQVPHEMGWNKQQYLDGICEKAGLAKGSYKNPRAKLQCFEALVFP